MTVVQRIFFTQNRLPRLAAFVGLVVALPVVVLGMASIGGWVGLDGVALVLVATVAVVVGIDVGPVRAAHED
ncbi:MAG: hypothetical protein QOG20_3779 [Pseudonocardiales bacterium]|nr:hypothetical protein [Pseudonocardiales bacterium]